MDAQQQLFTLMALAEEQQKAVQAAIEGLADERAALAKERAAVARAAASVAGVADEVRKAAADAVPALKRAAGEAVGASVKQSLAGAADAAVKALGEAAKPVIGSLSGVVRAAGEAEGSMRRAGAWFAWKWMGIAAAGMAGVCLVGLVMIWTFQDNVQSLRTEQAELIDSIAMLERKGARWIIHQCGKVPCIEVTSKKGSEWIDQRTGARLVIPKEY